jgi:hypothetical protein
MRSHTMKHAQHSTGQSAEGFASVEHAHAVRTGPAVESRPALLRRLRRGSAMGALLALGLMVAGPMAKADDKSAEKPADPSAKTGDAGVKMLDVLIFRSGNTVEGEIISQTESEVRIKVIAFGISSETTYKKADILEIKPKSKRVSVSGEGAGKSAGGEGTSGEGKSEQGTSAEDKAAADDPSKIVDRDGKVIPAGTMKVYVVPLGGEFGRDFSFRPVDRLLADLHRIQPEVVVFRFNFEFGFHGERYSDFGQAGSEGAFNQLEQASEMWGEIDDRIKSEKFKTKPRLVAWVKKALGGAAFMPMGFSEIYFTSDGLHGGLGGLDHLFKGVGDEVAQEKQRSLRLARAKGLAEQAGRDSRIVEAMTRGDYWMSYKLEGGEVVFRTEKPDGPDWILLKDDGRDGNADSPADILRLKGNDYLTLDAKTAQNIGWSKGTADTIEDLLFRMDVTRNFAIVKDRAGPMLTAWSRDVAQAERQIQDLFEKYRRVRVREPGGNRELNEADGQRIRILKDVKATLERFKRELNPATIRGAPEQIKNGIDRQINELELTIRGRKP